MSANTDQNIGRTFTVKGQTVTVAEGGGRFYALNGLKESENWVVKDHLDAFIARRSDNPADVAQAARNTLAKLDAIRAGAVSASTSLSAEDRAKILARITPQAQTSAPAPSGKVIVKPATRPAQTGDNAFRDEVSAHVAQQLGEKRKAAKPKQASGDEFADAVSDHVSTLLKAKG